MMAVHIDVQYAEAQADQAEEPPSEAELQSWAQKAVRSERPVQLGIRIVGENESRSLNNQYRGKDKPTNVLSFPMDVPEEFNTPMLGDLVICASVVEREAKEQRKPSRAHWAHMVVHGMLHLQGYDHENDDDAQEMEAIEIELLNELGFTNPYESE
jgi:probable rRNA maturation factor